MTEESKALDKRTRLKVHEIFYSLQGEANTVGYPTVFVRLTGCPLRCQYCDTEYAFHGGSWMGFDAIMAEVARFNTPYVTVSGGEPLSQKNCLTLLEKLCDEGYKVSLETSGAIDVSPVDSRVSRVVDIKTPGSNEADKNRFENLEYLTSHDQIKFVICDRHDFEWASALLKEKNLDAICTVLFSPSYQQLTERQLADWILEAQLPVKFQFQLHKFLWGDVQGK